MVDSLLQIAKARFLINLRERLGPSYQLEGAETTFRCWYEVYFLRLAVVNTQNNQLSRDVIYVDVTDDGIVCIDTVLCNLHTGYDYVDLNRVEATEETFVDVLLGHIRSMTHDAMMQAKTDFLEIKHEARRAAIESRRDCRDRRTNEAVKAEYARLRQTRPLVLVGSPFYQ